eukprot:COSAG06_NODE_50_length_28525_cov_88.227010_2_plen_56_part_00
MQYGMTIQLKFANGLSARAAFQIPVFAGGPPRRVMQLAEQQLHHRLPRHQQVQPR